MDESFDTLRARVKHERQRRYAADLMAQMREKEARLAEEKAARRAEDAAVTPAARSAAASRHSPSRPPAGSC